MKIIKKGKIPKPDKYEKIRFTCRYCGTIFEANKDEYYNTIESSLLLVSLVIACKCPLCLKEVKYEPSLYS